MILREYIFVALNNFDWGEDGSEYIEIPGEREKEREKKKKERKNNIEVKEMDGAKTTKKWGNGETPNSFI